MTASSSAPVSLVVLSRYTGALIDLAEESNSIKKIQKDFSELEAMIASSDELAQLISSPLVSQGKQEQIISEIAKKAKLQELTSNFLGVLVQNRRLNALSAIIKTFDREVSKRSGEVLVRIETASKLSSAEQKDFQAKISDVIGSNVSVETVVSPEILGGMIVTVGSYMVDDSVRRKLERLSSALKQGSNQNNINQTKVKNLKEVV